MKPREEKSLEWQNRVNYILINFSSSVVEELRYIADKLDKKFIYVNLEDMGTFKEYLEVLAKSIGVETTFGSQIAGNYRSLSFMLVLSIPEHIPFYEDFNPYTRGLMEHSKEGIMIGIKKTPLPDLPEVKASKLQGICFNVFKDEESFLVEFASKY